MIRRTATVLVALSLGALAAVVVAAPSAPAARARAPAAHHRPATRCVAKPRRRAHRRPAACRPRHRASARKPKPKPKPQPQPTSATTPTAGVPATPGPSPAAGAPPTKTSAAAPPPPPLPSRLGVDEQEYSVYPTHDPVGAGRVEFNVSNLGQDDHDFTIARAGLQIAQIGVIHAGSAQTLVVDLPPGSYKLYCSLYNHDQLGMHATLVVR